MTDPTAALPDAASVTPQHSDGARTPVDVFLVGTLFFDLILSGIDGLPAAGAEAWAAHRAVSAGGAANRAVAAARLGAETGLAVQTGTDAFADQLWHFLSAEERLNLQWSRRTPEVDTAVTVAVTDGADRRFLTHGTLDTLPWDALVPSALPRARATHLPVGTEVPDWARTLRSEGTMLVGGVGWEATQYFPETVLSQLEHVDAFVLNAQEATALTGRDHPDDAAARLTELVPSVVVTCAGEGAVAHDANAGERAHVPALPVTPVDPTGAGDVFVAAYMVATLDDWPLSERLLFASVSAGLSVGSLGGARSAPTLCDVENWLATPSAFASAVDVSYVRNHVSQLRSKLGSKTAESPQIEGAR